MDPLYAKDVRHVTQGLTQQPIVILVHGIRSKALGGETVGKIAPFFASAGYDIAVLSYGYTAIITPRFKNDAIAQQLAKATLNAFPRPVILVGHSNGCAIINLALQKYRGIATHVVYINPALDRHTPIPPCRHFDVWHSPSDLPTRIAEWLLPSKTRAWGAMGAYGPAKDVSNLYEAAVRVFNSRDDFPVSCVGHSDMFNIENIVFFGPMVVDKVQEFLPAMDAEYYPGIESVDK